MENRYFDLIRHNRARVEKLRENLMPIISNRTTRIVGSAPNTHFSDHEIDVDICVNGSLYNLRKNTTRSPSITYLNNALFRDENAYTKATYEVLRDADLGTIIHSNENEVIVKNHLIENNITYDSLFLLTKYDKRVIISELFHPDFFGNYQFDSNISNGVLMVVLALWAGALKVHMAGFSFDMGHAYSESNLSIRAHVIEDKKMLKLIEQNFPGIVHVGTFVGLH